MGRIVWAVACHGGVKAVAAVAGGEDVEVVGLRAHMKWRLAVLHHLH